MKKSKPRNRCVWGVQVKSYQQEVPHGPPKHSQFHIYAVHSSKKAAWKHILDILEDRSNRTGLQIRRQPWDTKYQKTVGNTNIEHYIWMLEYRIPHNIGPKKGDDYFVNEEITLYQWYVFQGEK